MNFFTAYFLTRALTRDGSFSRKSFVAKIFVVFGGMGWGLGLLMMMASQTDAGVTQGQFVFVASIIVAIIGCVIP